MILLDQVSKTFPGPDGQVVRAVSDVSLEVEQGETLCLIGTSGSGKTTTMKMINRLIPPTRGRIEVGGLDVQAIDPIRLRRRIGYVIQKGGLFPHMSVARNVGLLCHLEGWPREKTKSRVEELLALVNLPAGDYAHRYPGELSGGQRQRVGVARALALDPDYILMDEPFGALDPITRDQIHEEFSSLKAAVNKTIVIVTHDMAEAFKLGDRIALMHAGQLVQWGTEQDFRDSPASEFVTEFVKGHVTGPVTVQELIDPAVPSLTEPDQSRTGFYLVGRILYRGTESWETEPVGVNQTATDALARLLEQEAPGVVVEKDGQVIGVVTRESVLNAF